jgi:hypothetical protein
VIEFRGIGIPQIRVRLAQWRDEVGIANWEKPDQLRIATGSDNRPTVLRRFDGRWVATGDVMGKPVQYNVVAAPALHGQYAEISMNDVQVPSEYEARVFIGLDADSNTIIAHWLDSFGAQYSRPHGSSIFFQKGRVKANNGLQPTPSQVNTRRFLHGNRP